MNTDIIKNIFIFLALNFLALYLGALLMGGGVQSAWYQNANQAPWTPPGWVFGAAWTSIMIFYALYMAKLMQAETSKKQIIGIYTFQWILNVSWNPLFFKFQQVVLAELILLLLTALLLYQFIKYKSQQGWWNVLIMPYILWLLVANSLNMYFALNN